jgi:zinc and cadmium transporter
VPAGCVVLTLLYIVIANTVSTLISIGLAAVLSFRLLSGVVDKMVSVAAGVLLATALVQLLPEAMASDLTPQALGWVMTAGIVGFFVLEKMTLIHHTHHHEGDEHHHPHGYDAREAGRGAWPILVGDAFHNFGDGAVIAAAFLLDVRAGVLTASAVFAHEVPHEIGDFMILLNAGFERRRAFVFMVISGMSAVLGGVTGYLLLDSYRMLVPYALLIAAASFVYIALSDLLPEIMRRKPLRESLPEVALVLFGVAVAGLIRAAVKSA